MVNIPLFTIHPRWLAGFLPSTVLPFTTRTLGCVVSADSCKFFSIELVFSWWSGSYISKKKWYPQKTTQTNTNQIHLRYTTYHKSLGFQKHPENAPTCWWPKLGTGPRFLSWPPWWFHQPQKWIFKKPRGDVIGLQKIELVGGLKYFLFSSLFGEGSQFDWYFSKGLKPPTREPQSIWNPWISPKDAPVDLADLQMVSPWLLRGVPGRVTSPVGKVG